MTVRVQGKAAPPVGGSPKIRLVLRDHPRLVAFFVVYYMTLVVYGASTGATQTVFYAIFVGVAATIVGWLYSLARLSAVTLWGLALWGLAHMIGGLVEVRGEVVYEHSLGVGEFRFDKIVHFFGFGFATLAAYELVRQKVGPGLPRRSVAAIALFMGLGVGAVNETLEFLITLLPTESNVGGFSNTGWDLVANALGAATASFIAGRLDERRDGNLLHAKSL